ncbi:MAG: hypothetical protein ABTS22_20975 [Accumulibacter sp.]|uniref:DarT1-associated NADAR antitoxin family protein n=1 Tax=Accumulibacter sp. TaxID=2053492 RepID=UPI003314741D
MANRPVYIPGLKGQALVTPVSVEFKWVAGMAVTQKQKSIRSLHEAAAKRNIARVLEISSKSENTLGVKLSAFNLPFAMPGGLRTTVENAFQAGKVFRHGGPYPDLLHKTPRDAKKDPRLSSSGDLIGFRLESEEWPTRPITSFYDWVYLSALRQSPALAEQLLDFDGFTDIEFNPDRSLNCQAASAALFVALSKRGELESATASRDAFLERLTLGTASSRPLQSSLL